MKRMSVMPKFLNFGSNAFLCVLTTILDFFPTVVMHLLLQCLLRCYYISDTNHQECDYSVPNQSNFSLRTSLLSEEVDRSLYTNKPVIKTFLTLYKDGKQLYASYRYNTKVTPNSCVLECLHSSNKEASGKYSFK